MARKAKGKPLTLRPIRLDDDVWAECQRLGKEHGTINEGLRSRLLKAVGDARKADPEISRVTEGRIYPTVARPFKPPLLKPSEKGNK